MTPDAGSGTGSGSGSNAGDRTLADLRTVADYQFGAGAGAALFPPTEEADLEVRRSTSGRPRQVTCEAGRLVSYGTDGRFTLGMAGGRRLRDALEAPACRVVVGEESEPFVRDGKNAFAKFVREVDDEVRPRDEVVVVTDADEPLAVGRAELAAVEMRDFASGVAVKVREGAGED